MSSNRSDRKSTCRCHSLQTNGACAGRGANHHLAREGYRVSQNTLIENSMGSTVSQEVLEPLRGSDSSHQHAIKSGLPTDSGAFKVHLFFLSKKFGENEV
ncbi:hypothetical protein RRG08_029160 [Elysia crispata]|uniref:Uncharacterized protein n=1 Tax=Elysia crispata TaxID=231223 RepID=A0AAE1AK70_9GAST|nr:hypothetical protein RRG08_029160 [Elysia crispata]